MAPNIVTTTALLLTLSLLFFTVDTTADALLTPDPSPVMPPPAAQPSIAPSPVIPPPAAQPSIAPSPVAIPPTAPSPAPSPIAAPTTAPSPAPSQIATPTTAPSSAPSPSVMTCPSDALKFVACCDLLDHLMHMVMGTPPRTPCCPLLAGLIDFEAAICICSAIKANVFGMNIDIPITISLILDFCGPGTPQGFSCTA